jgi:hypothetical protein
MRGRDWKKVSSESSRRKKSEGLMTRAFLTCSGKAQDDHRPATPDLPSPDTAGGNLISSSDAGVHEVNGIGAAKLE